jgi:hypothetical protein
MIPAAPLSARLAERFGTKLVVAAGLATVAGALALMSTAGLSSGYGLAGSAIFILGIGMGLSMAPATESIMGSLPLAKAGVGSAVNDTTRQVGGALGVAVLGSLLSSSYASAAAKLLPAGLPAQVKALASDSVGAAVQVAAHIGGPTGQAVAAAGQAAFIDAMGSTLLVAAAVALAGSVLALLFLPARAPEVPEPADPAGKGRELEPIGA